MFLQFVSTDCFLAQHHFTKVKRKLNKLRYFDFFGFVFFSGGSDPEAVKPGPYPEHCLVIIIIIITINRNRTPLFVAM